MANIQKVDVNVLLGGKILNILYGVSIEKLDEFAKYCMRNGIRWYFTFYLSYADLVKFRKYVIKRLRLRCSEKETLYWLLFQLKPTDVKSRWQFEKTKVKDNLLWQEIEKKRWRA